jgi:hypothetical protein
MINCKESTRLTIKKEENKLTLREKLELSFHLLICKYCKSFSKQSLWINSISKSLHVEDSLSNSEKEAMEANLKNSN